MKMFRAMNEMLQDYSPLIQRFSVDESFMEYPPNILRSAIPESCEAATAIKDRIYSE
jgi:nucleotidyltransferase/DNA polymerase involved in DNA repair